MSNFINNDEQIIDNEPLIDNEQIIDNDEPLIDNDEIFALRIYYQDLYTDEITIIKKLKAHLLLKNYNINQINNILYNFYNYYGINITMEEIEEIQIIIPNNIFSHLFTHLINNQEPSNNQEEQEGQEEPLNNQEQEEEQEEEEQEEEQDNIINNNQEPINNNETINNYQVLPPNYTNTIQFNYNTNIFDEMFDVNIFEMNIETSIQNILNSVNNINNMMETAEDVRCTLDDNDISKLNILDVDTDICTPCSVCIENICKDDKMITLPCDHIFHADCILQWLKEYNYKCPNCKNPVGKAKYNI